MKTTKQSESDISDCEHTKRVKKDEASSKTKLDGFAKLGKHYRWYGKSTSKQQVSQNLSKNVETRTIKNNQNVTKTENKKYITHMHERILCSQRL